ncbi:MAG: GNAT family N-acetyltransferase [Pseudomonadota bacterium]
MPRPTYRRAEVADAAPISELILSSQAQFTFTDFTQEGQAIMTEACGVSAIAEILLRGDPYWVAEYRQHIIGVIGLRALVPEDGWHLVHNFVDVGWHRLGVSTTLWRMAREHCTQRGAHRVFLRSSHYARAIYRRWGFHDLGPVESSRGMTWTPMALEFPTHSTSSGRDMSDQALKELAPTGKVRAGINLGNFLLVTGKSANGDPEGVSPDMAREIANRLGVDIEYIGFDSPGKLADEAPNNVWDIGLIGAEPARAEVIDFTAAYVEIEATYLVPAGSPLKTIADVDKPGVRIAVAARSAYDLWLERNIKNAELVRVTGLDASMEIFVNDKLDALAGLRPRLITDVESLPGATILDGQFTAVQQAIGTPKGNAAGLQFLVSFVEEAKANGFVAGLIDKHGVQGRLSVAPRA